MTLQPVDWIVCSFVFAATLFIYNFQRIVKLKTATAFSGDRLIWMKRNLFVSNLLAIVGLLSSLFLFFLLEARTLVLLIPIGIVAIFYVGKFFFKGMGGLRDIPFLKVYFVSISWVCVSAGLPLLNGDEAWTEVVWMISASVFLMVFAVAIIFDLRDVSLDEKGKRTLPQLVGTNWTILIAVTSLFFSMTIPVLIDSTMWVLSLPVVVVGTGLLVNASEEKSDLFFSFYLDGLLILPGLISVFL